MSIVDHLKSALPKYKTKIPSSGKETFFRPFLVREEKILLLAQEDGDESTIVNAIATIVENCVEDIDNAKKIPMYDLEYLFCQIRAKSVSETAEPTFVCPETEETVKIGIKLTDLQVEIGEREGDIKLNETVKIRLKDPVVTDYINMDKENATDSLISKCFDTITVGDEVFSGKDLTDVEKQEIIQNLTHKQYEEVYSFIANQPKLYHVAKYRTKDGVERELRLEGIGDFFG